MTIDQSTLNMVRRMIAANVTGIADPNAIAADQMLYELGIDSLASVSLMVALAAETDVDLEDFSDDLDSPGSVGDLCQLAARFMASKSAALVE